MPRPVKRPSKEWHAFRSTCIARARYDWETKRLVLMFVGGAVQYTFEGVPEMQWLLFKSAPSHGKFYAKYIKGKYPAK